MVAQRPHVLPVAGECDCALSLAHNLAVVDAEWGVPASPGACKCRLAGAPTLPTPGIQFCAAGRTPLGAWGPTPVDGNARTPTRSKTRNKFGGLCQLSMSLSGHCRSLSPYTPRHQVSFSLGRDRSDSSLATSYTRSGELRLVMARGQAQGSYVVTCAFPPQNPPGFSASFGWLPAYQCRNNYMFW